MAISEGRVSFPVTPRSAGDSWFDTCTVLIWSCAYSIPSRVPTYPLCRQKIVASQSDTRNEVMTSNKKKIRKERGNRSCWMWMGSWVRSVVKVIGQIE